MRRGLFTLSFELITFLINIILQIKNNKLDFYYIDPKILNLNNF